MPKVQWRNTFQPSLNNFLLSSESEIDHTNLVSVKIIFSIFFVLINIVTGLGQCLSNYPPHYYYVTDSLDYTPGSLRQQILNANADGTGGVIWNNIPLNQATIYLQAPLPMITVDSLSVFDQDANWLQVIVDGGYSATDPVFTFSASAINSCFNNQWWVTLRNFAPATFQVVNVNDTGTGSLRDAISKSNISDSKDIIAFNIPGISPHTISLQSKLALENSIVIDGSTQPANGYVGSAPKIELNGSAGSFNAIDYSTLFLNRSISLEVYGLFINDFSSGIFSAVPAMNITIGSLNKPNVFSDCTWGMWLESAVGINIIGNYIGTDTSGINGLGNIRGIRLGYDTTVIISNNIVAGNSGMGMSIEGCFNSTIKSNKIGVNINGDMLPNGSDAIHFGWSEACMVGGLNSADQNIIAYSPVGVNMSVGLNVSVLRNSIYGNTKGIYVSPGSNNDIVPPIITKANHDTVSGTSSPLSRVEIFYNADPPNSAQGKIFIGFSTADTSGYWQYVGAVNNPCDITATQTDSGKTSEFSVISGMSVHLIGDTILCPGETITLDAGPGFESYSWNTADTTQTVNISASGIYIVQTVSPVTHCVSSDTVQILLRPGVSLITDTLICNTQSITLDAGSGFASYQWQDSSNSQFFLAYDTTGFLDTVVYFVNVIDTLGCASTDSVTVIFDECLFLSSFNSEEPLNIFPNPFDNKLNIQPSFSTDEKIIIKIIDGIGREVFIKSTSLKKQVLDLSFLTGGVYFLQLNGENTFLRTKILK